MKPLKHLIDFFSEKSYKNRREAIASTHKVIKNLGWHWNVCDDSQFGIGWMIRTYPSENITMKIFRNREKQEYRFAISYKSEDGYFGSSMFGNSFSECIEQMKEEMENAYLVKFCHYDKTSKEYRKLVWLDSKGKI